MMVLFRILSWLPLWLLHGIGWGLGWVVFALSPTYRRRFVANLQQAGHDWRECRGAVGQTGQLVAELPRLWFGRPANVLWDGAQHIEHALAQGRGIVFLTPHLGSFEITAQAYAARFGARQPITVLFRPSRQPRLRALVASARSRPGLLTAPTTMAGVKQLIKALRQGQSVGLLPDQVPPQGLGVWAPFYGREAYTMTLSARLAQQTGAVVLLAWGERLSWGRGYTVHVQPLGTPLPSDPQAAAAVINLAMEQVIATCPQQYLWGYARYKQPREERL
ncbi:lysophospholipid acyltransferase family protein [Curvibacter sp. PAE-UM]|uniref:lysophospholipid acyltransferase family protein n=1 Tax=Curvibacter sp. PAE-UM TaxID=1714344 RepID=UPI00071054FA|nr:lysophospholipid acyltransferase family protein [Curvibacter sp. PAE-UM]KRI01632.1 lipid A biosynthesis acyltransferase [Curvibacter sp. PAE-UM]